MEKTIPEFSRTVVTTLTGTHGKIPCTFTVRVTNSTDAPGWHVTLSDYDDSVGAVGEFSTERDALSNMAAFLALAIPLYFAKHAKFGPPPIVSPGRGGLVVHFPLLWGVD